jgi:hypothetical protein
MTIDLPTWRLAVGLEGVEMVMAVEKEFGVDIPDADAGAMRVVRDLSSWVEARVGARPLGPCRTRRAFYRLRRALVDELGVPRAAVRPRAPLDSILPERLPAERRRRLEARVGTSLLRRVGWWDDTLHELMGERRTPRYRSDRAGQTVGDTARDLAADAGDLRPPPGQPWSREGVALMVRHLIHYEFAEYGFSDDASFVKDLGFD